MTAGIKEGAVVALSYHKQTYQGIVTAVTANGIKVKFTDSQQVTRVVWRLAGEVRVVVR